MTTIEANVPDYVAKLAMEVAAREKTTVDQIVALALAAPVEAWKIRDDMETRARQANPADLDLLLDKVISDARNEHVLYCLSVSIEIKEVPPAPVLLRASVVIFHFTTARVVIVSGQHDHLSRRRPDDAPKRC